MFKFKALKNFFLFSNFSYNQKEFVFYSESKFYRNFFICLINDITKRKNKKIIYLTSDEDDEAFFKNNKRIKVLFIGKGLLRSILFLRLKCKFLIMTLTDLDNHLKKSKECKKYVYFFHSPASTHMVYTKEAFKNYDIIFCNGNYQIEELKKSEILNNYAAKEFIKTGYLYFDYLLKNSLSNISDNETILFAPSWNYNSQNLFDDYCLKILDILLKNDLKVILRPHPEHFKRSKKIIDKIRKEYLKRENFILDMTYSNLNSMEKSHVLITDNSLIAMEFALIFKKQPIYINYSNKTHNKDYFELELEPIEEKFKNKFGIKVDINKIEKIVDYCRDTKMNINFSKENLSEFISENFFNFGFSSNFASDYLIKKSEQIK